MAQQVKRASRYRFYPTDGQAAELSRTFGCVRLVYNKALEERTRVWYGEQRRVCYVQSSAALTGWKKTGELAFLIEVSSVPLQQALRHLQTAFGNFFAKRAKYPRYKKVARQREDTGRKWAKAVVRDHDRLAVEDFRPRFLATSTMARKAADAAIGATKQALTHMARKHGRELHLVHPAHTTMDCAQCGARTKHALPLSERTYACTACGAVSPRDKNSARVMLVRAGLNPAGADRVRAGGPLVPSQREPGIPVLQLQGGEDVKDSVPGAVGSPSTPLGGALCAR